MVECSSLPVKMDFCDYYLGDMWNPSITEFGPIINKENNDDMLSGTVFAKMQIRTELNRELVWELSTAPQLQQGQLVISMTEVDGNFYTVIQLPPQEKGIPIEREKFKGRENLALVYDLEIYKNPLNAPLTIFRGKLNVQGDVTYA